MPLIIPTTLLPDPPSFDEFVLQVGLQGGFFQILNEDAELQLLFGATSAREESQAVILSPGSYSSARAPSGKPLVGIKARNAVIGRTATIRGYFWDEVTPSINFVGAVGTALFPVDDISPGTEHQIIKVQGGAAVWTDLSYTSYIPVWGSTGVAPGLGNGTLTGSWIRIGKYVLAQIALVFGGTSTPGTGGWTFTLPFVGAASEKNPIGMGLANDVGTDIIAGQCRFGSGPGDVAIRTVRGAPDADFGAGVPMVWAAGDTLNLKVEYLAA